jgi:hypothetical protein
VIHVGDERDGAERLGHCGRLEYWVSEVLERATVVVAVVLPGEAPAGMVRARNGSALDAGLGVLRPEERVEVVIGSFERSGLFEAPMSTLLQRSAPTSWLVFGSEV